MFNQLLSSELFRHRLGQGRVEVFKDIPGTQYLANHVPKTMADVLSCCLIIDKKAKKFDLSPVSGSWSSQGFSKMMIPANEETWANSYCDLKKIDIDEPDIDDKMIEVCGYIQVGIVPRRSESGPDWTRANLESEKNVERCNHSTQMPGIKRRSATTDPPFRLWRFHLLTRKIFKRILRFRRDRGNVAGNEKPKLELSAADFRMFAPYLVIALPSFESARIRLGEPTTLLPSAIAPNDSRCPKQARCSCHPAEEGCAGGSSSSFSQTMDATPSMQGHGSLVNLGGAPEPSVCLGLDTALDWQYPVVSNPPASPPTGSISTASPDDFLSDEMNWTTKDDDSGVHWRVCQRGGIPSDGGLHGIADGEFACGSGHEEPVIFRRHPCGATEPFKFPACDLDPGLRWIDPAETSAWPPSPAFTTPAYHDSLPNLTDEAPCGDGPWNGRPGSAGVDEADGTGERAPRDARW